MQGALFMAKAKNKIGKAKAIKSGAVVAEKRCTWVVDIPDDELNNRDTKKIINFYLFHTPIEKVCELARPLERYGWHKPWSSPEYLDKKMAEATTNENFLKKSEYVEDMTGALESVGLLNNFTADLSCEKACIYAGKEDKYLSVLHHIRNCFAHGRFRIFRRGKGYDVYYAFEDMTTTGHVSARMLIKQTTLKKWIDIIEAGPD